MAVISATHITQDDWECLEHWSSSDCPIPGLVAYAHNSYGFEVVLSTAEFLNGVEQVYNAGQISQNLAIILKEACQQGYDRLLIDVDGPSSPGLPIPKKDWGNGLTTGFPLDRLN